MFPLYANYHTHSYHCRHASGQPKDYVEAALRAGIHILGFSDHIPCSFGTGHRSGFRMDESETARYVEEVLALREAYKGQIQIYVGYEAEYYPGEFQAVLEKIRQYECDYLILGQHFTHNEYDGIYVNGKNANTEGALVQYVNQLIEGMETGLFSYVAHPDILRYRADDRVYAREMKRLCKAAGEMAIPLELNFLGLKENRPYPYDKFWKLVGEVGAPVIFGCDAHSPEALEDTATLNKAKQWAEEYGLLVQPTVALRPVRKDHAL